MKNFEVKFAKEITLSAMFISDIFDTAFEGGINYWCSEAKTTYDGEGDERHIVSAILTDAEADDGNAIKLTQELTVEALAKIIDGTFKCRSDIRDAITRAVFENDGGYIDADGADVIVQFAVFKELVYG